LLSLLSPTLSHISLLLQHLNSQSEFEILYQDFTKTAEAARGLFGGLHHSGMANPILSDLSFSKAHPMCAQTDGADRTGPDAALEPLGPLKPPCISIGDWSSDALAGGPSLGRSAVVLLAGWFLFLARAIV